MHGRLLVVNATMHASSTTLPAPLPSVGASPPRPTARVDPPDRARRAPSARELGGALLGLLALGGAAALGTAGGGSALRLAPSVLLVDLAALAMTAPALIVIHQFVRLAATPEALAAALGRALIHGGRVAGGLAVVMLFMAATTNLAVPLLLVSLLAVGVFTSATASIELGRAELEASRQDQLAPRFAVLVLAWLALSWIIALRVGVDVGAWVLGVPGGLR